MKKTTRFAALALAVLMALTSFAGCNKKSEEDSGEKYVYPATYFDLKEFDNANIRQMAAAGEKVYVLADMPTGETVDTTYTDENGEPQTYTSDVYKNVLYEIDASTGEMKKLDAYVDDSTGYSEDTESLAEQHYVSVDGMIETGDGRLAIVKEETSVKYDLPADFNPESDSVWNYNNTTKILCRIDIIDESGAVVSTLKGPEREYNSNGEYYDLRAVICDKDNNWYMFTSDGVAVYNSDFSQQLFALKGDNINGSNINNIVRTSDGSVAALMWDNSGNQVVKTIDLAKKDFTAGSKLSMSTVYLNSVFTGNNEYDFFGTDETGIVGVKTADGTAERVVNWLDSDLSPDYIQHVSAMENGDFILYNQDWESEKADLIRLVKTLNDPANQKKIITMAVTYMDTDVRNMVAEFNKKNTEYRIKVVDYSEYNTGDDYTAGITKLNTEIIAGKVPDILAVSSSMPITQYTAKGILEDLTPYIERDMGKDALVEDFFKSLRDSEGKLYEIYSSFSLQSLVGLKSVVGDGSDWTFKTMQEALAKLPEGASLMSEYYSRSSAMYMFLYSNMDRFINRETGECSFDSEDFIELLETVKTFPADDEIDYENMSSESDQMRVLSGKQLLSDITMWNLTDFRANTFYVYGKDASVVGYPGTGSVFTTSGMGYALSAKSENKEVAWQFISQILTKDYQTEQNKYGYYNGIPTNKEVFDAMTTEEATPEFDTSYPASGSYVVSGNGSGFSADGEKSAEREPFYEGATNAEGVHEMAKTTYDFGDGMEVSVYAMTDYEKEAILDIFKNTTAFMRYDTSLSDIINEEVQPFFKGEKSAADAAKMIQSRATIYINEQR